MKPNESSPQQGVSDPDSELGKSRFWSVQFQSPGLSVDSDPELHSRQNTVTWNMKTDPCSSDSLSLQRNSPEPLLLSLNYTAIFHRYLLNLAQCSVPLLIQRE